MARFWDARAREDAWYFVDNRLPYRRGGTARLLRDRGGGPRPPPPAPRRARGRGAPGGALRGGGGGGPGRGVRGLRGRGRRGRRGAAGRGGRVAPAVLRATADAAGLEVERAVGEGTQFCVVGLRRR